MGIAKMIRTMKTQPSTRAPRAPRKNSAQITCSLPRLFLFVELFVEKEIPHRSLK